MTTAPVRRSPARHLAGILCATLSIGAAAQPAPDLLDLSLEQLGDIRITSVSRRSQRLSDAAASVFVIGADDIRRSGATSLPEALRLAPNLQVARTSATMYAISARGFNNSLGNKLLVLIDGRTVYTPLFSGVFWDAQDLMLEDVERIEVISGPGATLWGANAVNGVINVITRASSATRGSLAAIQAGGDGRSAAFRRGGTLGAHGSYRAYGKYSQIDPSVDADGTALPDGWRRNQAGFRADWGEDSNTFHLQGGGYRARSHDRPDIPIDVSGLHLLAAWSQDRPDGSGVRLQTYFDRSERDDPLLFHDRMDVFDIEFHHAIPVGRHNLLWGGGYRRARDEVQGGLLMTFFPPRKHLHWENIFVRNEMALGEDLALTMGVKLDRNVYTGTEVLPSLRAAWKPADGQLLWSSASRAVRAPSRVDREFHAPGAPPFIIVGGPEFVSEVSDVLQIGYRAQTGSAFSYSVTAFHHRHDDLRSGQPQPDGTFRVENGTAGRSSGVEAWGHLQVGEAWGLSAGLLHLRQRFWTKPGSNDPDGGTDLGNDPKHQWSLRSTLALSSTLRFDVSARKVGALPAPHVPGYVAVDASLGWQPDPDVDVSLFLRNLFDASHAEFGPGPFMPRSEFERSASVRLLWRW